MKGGKQMNVTTCAPTKCQQTNWDSIDWNRCELAIKKLQARIVKAQKEGRYGKVKSLQWTLTHSFYAKALAVKRVTSNSGSKTSGVDGKLWSTPRTKANAIKELKRRGYKPKPLKRVHIKKSNGKLRPLGIPTLKDRAMQALYLMALEPVSEVTADTHSYGFRKKRCTMDAVRQIHNVLCKGYSAQWILEGDIKGCFDHISHNWLMENIPMDKVILKKWLTCGYVLGKQLFPTEEGTPQGGIISPTLANMVLDGLQGVLAEKYKRRRNGKRHYSPMVNFVRYADDFIITSENREVLETEIKPLVKEFLAERGLTLSEEKTLITNINDGFDFLGFNIRKFKGQLLTKPSKSAQKRVYAKFKTVIERNKSSRQDTLIRLLNPIITGWSNYYRYGASSKEFQRMDHLIFDKLWQWAKRRHPKKGKRWIAIKYFHTIKGRKWRFVYYFDKKNPENRIMLKLMSDLNFSVYTQVKGDANPFDSECQDYFDQRKTKRMLESFNGKKTLVKIWQNQKGLCPICGDTIDESLAWSVKRETLADDKKRNQLVHMKCIKHPKKNLSRSQSQNET